MRLSLTLSHPALLTTLVALLPCDASAQALQYDVGVNVLVARQPAGQHHLETFLAETAAADPNGDGVPRWVEADFRAYLRCGILAHGFARIRYCAGHPSQSNASPEPISA